MSNQSIPAPGNTNPNIFTAKTIFTGSGSLGGMTIGQPVAPPPPVIPQFHTSIDYIIAQMFQRGWNLTNAVASNSNNTYYANSFTLTFSSYTLYQKTEIRGVPQIPIIDSSSIEAWNTICDQAIRYAGPIT